LRYQNSPGFFYDLGVNKYTAFRFVPMGRGAKNPNLWVGEPGLKWLKEEYRGIINDLGTEFFRFDHSLNFFSGEQWCEGGGCELSQKFLCIKPNGDVVACPFFPVILGNIKKDNLIHIWRHSSLLQECRSAIDMDKLQGRCIDCPTNIKSVCRGGCRAVAYHMTGNMYAPDPRCWR